MHAHKWRARVAPPETLMAEPVTMRMLRGEADLERLLEYLRTRGLDFTGYKRASLERRIAQRMACAGVDGFDEYAGYLDTHRDELRELIDTVLINVTGFFRDADTWNVLAASVIPELLAQRPRPEPIRVWSAGCASGEEAYTLAILFCEILGIDGLGASVTIHATDVDEHALARARRASYSAREVADVPAPLLSKYFESGENRFVVREELRRRVTFATHDLIQDAPMTNVDLLVCRNVLMYFTAETQAQILADFHLAVDPNGVVVLGRAETLLTHASGFMPLDVERRISRRLLT